MTEAEKKIVQRTYHEIALLAIEKAKIYNDECEIAEAMALDNFADDLWLRINDFDIEVQK